MCGFIAGLSFFFFFLLHLYWSIIALQLCVRAVEERLCFKKEEVVKITNNPIKVRTEFSLNLGTRRSLLPLQGGILVR